MSGLSDTEPSHQSVREAVTATGDAELDSLIDSAESYVLRPARLQGDVFALFHVVLLEVSHPMGVLLAVDRGTGRALVTSGEPDAVREVVAADPGLAEPHAVWELVRSPPMDGELLDAVSIRPGRYEFRVRDRETGAVRRLALSLSDRGSTWREAG
ncbi:MAG: hypothetical protein ACRDPC_16205 [Solirubrobacteraceae bacterium]